MSEWVSEWASKWRGERRKGRGKQAGCSDLWFQCLAQLWHSEQKSVTWEKGKRQNTKIVSSSEAYLQANPWLFNNFSAFWGLTTLPILVLSKYLHFRRGHWGWGLPWLTPVTQMKQKTKAPATWLLMLLCHAGERCLRQENSLKLYLGFSISGHFLIQSFKFKERRQCTNVGFQFAKVPCVS